MNLIIDIGNTSTKLALSKGAVIVKKDRISSPDPAMIDSFTGKQQLEGVIVSSVSHDPSRLISYLRDRCSRVHRLTWQSHFPFGIDYETPETLGVDRLAAAAGAWSHHPQSDLLVVDAGSALTIDVITGGIYRGGSISPGLSMRFRALHEYTGQLPLITAGRSFSFPGRSTKDAIAGGVIMGMVYEINEYIRTFEERHKNPVTLITGGDSEMLVSLMERKLLLYPDLVTDGLIYLLDTNV
jgi:type III pantothenate kinase